MTKNNTYNKKQLIFQLTVVSYSNKQAKFKKNSKI